MSQRILSTIGIIAAVLVLAVLVGIVGVLYARPVTAQSTVGVTGMRQITVVGQGEVKGRPDTATVQIGVETEAPTSQEALAKNNTQAQTVQQRLKDLGVAENDLQTSNFNIFPVYGPDGKQLTGYRVNNTVSVTIRNLDQAGALLDQVVQTGANSIYGISFSVSDNKALLDQARVAAMQSAREHADQLAKAGGATVGEVLVITENVGSASPIPMPLARAELAQDTSAAPVQAGEQTFTVNIQVTYGLR